MSRKRVLHSFAVLLVGLVAVAFGIRIWRGEAPRALDQSSFYRALDERRIETVSLASDGNGWNVRGQLRTKEKFTAYLLEEPGLPGLLRESGVAVQVEQPARDSVFFQLLSGVFLLLFATALLLHVLGAVGAGGISAAAIGRWRDRGPSPGAKATFADVAGVEEAKLELHEVVEFLQKPGQFRALGGRVPTGVLLVGPPGTGKTLLARAVAGEAGTKFLTIAGSELVEMYVGLGAARVRDLFARARKSTPCIVFIDELDAVGRARRMGGGAESDEREQTLNQLLVELDGFASHEGVIVLAATNRADVLDPALLRPGRFDRQVVLERPDVRGREEILALHTRKVPLAADVEPGLLARMTPGWSGADLGQMVNEAALHAAARGREIVAQEDLERARDKVLMGRELRSVTLRAEERHAMACHEAGHALVAHVLPEADPLHKVTIIPRGTARGTTQQLPTSDRHLESRSSLLAAMCVQLGGRVAEELLLNRVSSGSAPDLERVTKLARRMVSEWGMSESLGPVLHRDTSDATVAEIDREVRRLVLECHGRTRQLLEERSDALARVAGALLVHETLAAGQVASLIEG